MRHRERERERSRWRGGRRRDHTYSARVRVVAVHWSENAPSSSVAACIRGAHVVIIASKRAKKEILVNIYHSKSSYIHIATSLLLNIHPSLTPSLSSTPS